MKCPRCATVNPDTQRFCGDCGTDLDHPSEDLKIPPADLKKQASFTRTMETPPDELTRGTLFAGRYEIIEELGEGGMGAVYRAHDTKLNEEVALKLIRPEIAADKRTVERFRNEIKIARRITHKNVCRTHDFGEEGKTLYLTMEYVRGEDLKSFIKRSKVLSTGTALAITRQIAEGLGEAHKQGVTHRDLKPGNVMIDKDGQAKVMDFGIARSLHGGGITAEGGIIGTPEYMSPEQVEGKPADGRADIYALGIILFEMVTGRVPFEGETAFSIANKHQSELPPVPKKLAPQIPEGLSRLILRCLEKDRAKRYQTTEELIADLAMVEDALPTAERFAPRRKTITHREVTVKFQPRKLVIPAAAVFVMAIILVFFWRPWSSRPAFTPPPIIENSIAVISLENQTGDKANDYLCRRALPDAFIVNLENSGLFSDVPTWERMTDLFKSIRKKEVEFIDDDLGFELCRRLGIKTLVSGSLNRAGETYNVVLRIIDAESRKSLGSFKSEGGTVDSLLKSQIDGLSRDICKALGIAVEKIGPGLLNIAGVTTSSKEAYEHFLKGKDLHYIGQTIEAKAAFEKAIEIDSSFAMAYKELAWVFMSLGDFKARQNAIIKAKKFSGQATEKEKLFIEASFANGVEGDAAKCIRIFENIVSKYPKDKEAHWRLGSYLSDPTIPSDLRDLNRGIREMEKALALDPNDAYLYGLLGGRYVELGDFEKAIGLIEKYASLSPGSSGPVDSIGYGYYRWGKLDEAIRLFGKAVKINPVHHGTYWSLAYTCALKEDYKEALGWLDRLDGRTIPLRAQVDTYQFRGFLNLWLGRFEQSLLDFKKAEEIDESAGNKEARNAMDSWRWIVFLEKGDFDISRENIQRWLEGEIKRNDPDFAKILGAYRLGLIDVRQENPDLAKKRLEVIKPLLPGFSTFVEFSNLFSYFVDILDFEIGLRERPVEIGRVLQAFGEDRVFLAPWSYLWSITRVIQFLNSPPYVRDFIPRAYLQRGELDKAIAAYERLVTFNPETKDRRLIHPLNYYRLGKVYEQKGDKRKAKANFRKFLNLWKDADSGLPEVEDAKKRLAAL